MNLISNRQRIEEKELIKTKYKIQYKGNTRRYLVNDRWVTARGVPELREKQDQTDSQYINSERGKIMEVINSIFLRYKHKKDRYKVWYPEVDKKEMWRMVMNYIAYMKHQFPKSDGRLCFFCEKPWTYIRRKSKAGVRKLGSVVYTNFSIDRFDCEQTYKKGNIVCCCFACNGRKGSSTKADWRTFIKKEKELKKMDLTLVLE